MHLLPLLMIAAAFWGQTPDCGTVAVVNDFGHGRNRDIAAAKEVAACPLLPEVWQRLVLQRAMGREL